MRIFFNVFMFFIENNENFNENVVTFNPKTKKNDPGTNGRGYKRQMDNINIAYYNSY